MRRERYSADGRNPVDHGLHRWIHAELEPSLVNTEDQAMPVLRRVLTTNERDEPRCADRAHHLEPFWSEGSMVVRKHNPIQASFLDAAHEILGTAGTVRAFRMQVHVEFRDHFAFFRAVFRCFH